MQIKRIHFVGIKGVGMTPLALIAKEAGMSVTGSDTADEFITDPILRDAGIYPLVGFDASHIETPDVVITTGAHGGYDNIEVQTAKSRGIPVLTQGQAVGEFMRGEIFGKSYTGVSVAGSHGKTTTTAMIATILQHAGKDPSYVIGTSDIFPLGKPGHFGLGEYFIAEADEYATEPTHDKTAKFLWQHPLLTVFTNIELDHPDIYPTIESVRSVFLQFAKQLPEDGTLIACGDSEEVETLLKEYTGNVLTYGLSEKNTYTVKNIKINYLGTLFDLYEKGVLIGRFQVGVPGEHNALNATAAFLVAKRLGLSIKEIQEGLERFKGTKRRLEYIGQLPTGAFLYDDYAHHPTEIQKTLQALRSMFPDKKIVCFFQPHTYSRTKKLFEQFVNSFESVDTVGIISIYPSAREEIDLSVSSELLVEATKKHHQDVHFFKDATDVVQYLTSQQCKDDTIVITMGAGDLYQIKEKLIVNS
jgi:UDP-N-acetylmuramate--alanine ligase